MSEEKDALDEVERIWANQAKELSQLSDEEAEAAVNRVLRRRAVAYCETIGAFVAPILVAVTSPTSYSFAFSVAGVGLFLYIFGSLLTVYMLEKKLPGATKIPDWEHRVPVGLEGGLFVPRWTSHSSLIGYSLFPSGLIVAFLLWVGIVD